MKEKLVSHKNENKTESESLIDLDNEDNGRDKYKNYYNNEDENYTFDDLFSYNKNEDSK